MIDGDADVVEGATNRGSGRPGDQGGKKGYLNGREGFFFWRRRKGEKSKEEGREGKKGEIRRRRKVGGKYSPYYRGPLLEKDFA